LSRQTIDADVRKYTRLGTTALLALRLRGFRSWAGAGLIYFGGNSVARLRKYLAVPRLAHARSRTAELRFRSSRRC